jgi:DNA-nicking Smr family endonuclease
MSKRSQRHDPAGRAVTAEEADLWREATRSLERVQSKARVGHARPPRAPSAPPATAAAGEPVGKPRSAATANESPRAPRRDSLGVLDRRQARRILAGKTGIDDRIDLHGLRQAEAHARLRAFLARASARGLKTVLVITGKGLKRETGDHPEADGAAGEPGILRRSLPLWLAQPDLSRLVLSYGAAGTRHGGDGAFYVRLRKAAGSA